MRMGKYLKICSGKKTNSHRAARFKKSLSYIGNDCVTAKKARAYFNTIKN